MRRAEKVSPNVQFFQGEFGSRPENVGSDVFWRFSAFVECAIYKKHSSNGTSFIQLSGRINPSMSNSRTQKWSKNAYFEQIA